MQGLQISDHWTVHFSINAAKPHPPRMKITFRKLRNIDQEALKRDLREAIATINNVNPPDEEDSEAWLERYDMTLNQLLERHAPHMEAFVVQKPRAHWYMEEIAEAKRLRRRLEKQWKRTGLTVHHEMFKKQKNFVTALIDRTRSKFYCDKIEECQGDQKSLFRVADRLLHRKTADSCDIPAEKMSDFFVKKIRDIWEELQDHDADDGEGPLVDPISQPPPGLEVLSLASIEEVARIIKTMSNATCDLDPMPTPLVKQHLDVLAPLYHCGGECIAGIGKSACKTQGSLC
jgi:hypothetical protein